MWKECKICNSYEVSTEGEVRRKETGKILKQKLDKHNYLQVGLSMGARGRRKMAMVHRLVAEAFIPNPENKPQVNHIDGDTINNNVSNLEWVTVKENQEHARRTGLKPEDRGELSSNSKMTTNEIQYCRLMYKPKDKTYGCAALAKRFGVAKSTMSYIVNNKTYIRG